MKEAPANKLFYGVDSIRFVWAFIVMLSHFDNLYAIALKQSSHAILRGAVFSLKTPGHKLARHTNSNFYVRA